MASAVPKASLNSVSSADYYDPDMASNRSPTPSLFGGREDVLGVSYFDIAMGMAKDSIATQLRSSETWRAVSTEFFGAFLLCFITGGGISAIGLPEWNAESSGIYLMAITYSLVLFGLCSGLCPLGFAFFNPTTTIGTVVAGRLGVARALFFLGVQVVGAVAGALSASAVHLPSASAYCVEPQAEDISNGAMFLMETVSAVMVAFVSVCVYNDRRNASARWPTVYAALSFGVIIACARASGSAANPAWSLGFGVVSGCLNTQWAVWGGNVVGAICAGILFRLHQFAREDPMTTSRSRATSSNSISYN